MAGQAARRRLEQRPWRIHEIVDAIMPFRHLLVYPPMLAEVGDAWRAGADQAVAGR